MTVHATSLSVYRGQSRSGDGEGPGQAILRGEQYLHVDRELYESELLDAIRSWMTLDSDPLDHQRLNDRLESWSLFSLRDYLFVVRLVSAGRYDQRAAYFSHARVWKRSSLPRTFDPGLNLGRETAFAQPWRDQDAVPPEALETLSSLVRPQQIKEEAETASLFLAHLFQTMTQQSALIITAPVAEFASGSALHALVSFARGGLPAEVRDPCRIRVYSRIPDKFLRHLGTHLLVVPEPAAADAVAARSSATLLDRRGNKVMGKDLDPRFLDYARWVVERATALPDGLAQFSARYAFRPHEFAPGESARASVQITYNVASALTAGEHKALMTYLPSAATAFGPGLDWNRFIADDAWQQFPRELLLDRLLSSSDAAAEGERELLRTIAAKASRLGIIADDRLDGWWNADDAAKVQRLVAMLMQTPPLVSDAASAKRTIHIPLERLAAYGPVHRVLEAEARTGWIGERTQASELATFATEPAVFAVLRDAVAAGALNVEWAQIFVRRAPAEQIVNAAHVWLADPTFWTAWESLPTVLLDRLRSMQPAPVSLRAAIVDGCGLDPVAGVRLYIRIADLLARLDEADGGDSATQLVERLLERVPRFAEDDRAFLETVIFDSGWRCLRIAALALPDLLQVARLFRKDESFALLYDEIDRRFRREPEGTTAALVKSGWWSFWRSRSRLSGSHPADAKALERGAREWLRSSRGDVTMEAWQLALRDLPNQLTGEDLARLRTDSADGAAWPLIAPFEQQQIEDLARRAADLGALAEIAEAVPGEGSRTLVESVLSRSPYASELPAEALACLIVLPNRRAAQLPVLPLRDSATLWKRAGHRRAQAMEARIRSVAAALHDTPVQALHAASSPSLWRNDDFRAELAQWLAGKRSAAAIGTEALGLIEREIEGAAEPRPAAPRELIASLVQQGRRRTAHFLDRDAAQRVQHDALATSALHALLQKRANDPCWQKLADSVRFAHKERALHPRQHPLRLLAAQIATAELAREDRATLFTDGWQTLEKVARQHKVLIAQPPFESHGFPIFDLAATMLGPGSIGVAAVRIRELADLLSRKDAAWWRRLLAGVRAFRRYGDVRCSDDREELALALLLDALTAAPDEHRALSAAMAAEAKTNAKWTPLAEFGMEAL